METLLDQIRAAAAPDASAEARSVGATACRAILAALETTPGQPLAQAPQVATPIAQVIGSMRGVPIDQLLDLAIHRLRAALPAGADVPAAQKPKIQLVPLPGIAGSKP